MLRVSIACFFLCLLALALGAYEIGGVSLELGRLLMFVFLILSIVSFVASLVTDRKMERRHPAGS